MKPNIMYGLTFCLIAEYGKSCISSILVRASCNTSYTINNSKYLVFVRTVSHFLKKKNVILISSYKVGVFLFHLYFIQHGVAWKLKFTSVRLSANHIKVGVSAAVIVLSNLAQSCSLNILRARTVPFLELQ